MKGKKHTDESRLKMSENRKGYTPWNKGITPPEEVRRKISKANTGHPTWMKGKKHTEESKRKMSEALKGRTPWNKGKKVSNPHWLGRKHTDESRRKMSEATKGRTAWNKGKKGIYTDETLRRMSKARETPDCIAAREFFFSLPSDMDLREKRKHLRQKFPNKSSSRIYKWCKKFDSETQSTVSDA